MANKKSIKKDIIQWVVFIGIITILYVTGLHTPVLGALQGLVLKTGLVSAPTTEKDLGEAEYGFTLINKEGNEIPFESFKGKTIFLNLWATWCPPCIAEMPDINDLYNDLESDDVEFVMLSLDDSFETAKLFVDKKDFQLPIYALKSRIPEAYHTQSIPTTFVISPEGKIVMTKKGMARYNTEKFKEFLTSLSEK